MSRGPSDVDSTVAPVLGREMHGQVIGGDGGGKSSVLNVPTLLMRTLLDRARESNLPLVLPEEIEGLLKPTGVHLIGQAREVTEPVVYDGVAKLVHWIRAHVMLALVDDPDPYVAWLDFDGDTYGKVYEAAQKAAALGERFHVPYGERGKPIVPEKPKWVGSRAFGPVFERATTVAQHHPIEFGQEKLPVMQVMATTEATLLADAHVLCVDPAQVEVLPEWESPQEVFDFAADATLPFEPLFLDFTGPGGFAPAVTFTENNPLRLRGALIWKQSMIEHGEVLIVAPYAWPEKLPDSFDGEVTEWQSSGWFIFNSVPSRPETGEVVEVGAVRLFLGATQLYAEPATCWADAAAEIEPVVRGPLPGYAALPFSAESVLDATSKDPDLVSTTIMLWGMMAWRAARVALAALSILEAVEVEFVDAPMEKRDRKRAVKRGWPIAQTVVIRSHSKRYRVSSSTGEEAHYSHRFWRRATVAHYPLGTQLADARPDLVTPCKRPMGSNCGYCRKVKRPACIVGPEDKPLVLKTLVRRKDAA